MAPGALATGTVTVSLISGPVKQFLPERGHERGVAGTWEKILDQLRAGCDEAAGRAWTIAVDATVVPGAPACGRGAAPAAV